MTNIKYTTDEIYKFYSHNRCKWDDFYESEKWIFSHIVAPHNNMGSILDVGCATGGLGFALREKFNVKEYIGIEINEQCVKNAKIAPMHNIICGDIVTCNTLPQDHFDNVFSLSCADWNVETEKIIDKSWSYVKRDGHFIISLRLTPMKSLKTLEQSYQYIHFGDTFMSDDINVEKAPYVVLNVYEALNILSSLSPAPNKITVYGYWGKPSYSAHTRYDRILFSVFAIRKGINLKNKSSHTDFECHWPLEIFTYKGV